MISRQNLLACVTIIVACLSATSASWAATIDFETRPDGLPVEAGQNIGLVYRPLGVTLLDSNFASFPNAPSRGFVAVGPDDEHVDRQLVIQFTTPQSVVRFHGAIISPGEHVAVLRAYDAAGVEVAVDGPKVGSQQHGVDMAIQLSSPSIVRVVYDVKRDGFALAPEFIDDLTFEGEPPAPQTVPAPVVRITVPDGSGTSEYHTDPLVVTGTVTGESLYPDLEITLTSLDPEHPADAERRFMVRLATLSGEVPFSMVLSPPGLPVGRYRIHVRAMNTDAREGNASTEVGLPAWVRQREAVHGPFRFAVVQAECNMLFFANRAVAWMPVFSVERTLPLIIAEKWRHVRSPVLGRDGYLGCPVENGLQSHIPGVLVQRFERGRIYAFVPPYDRPSVFVPNSLANMMAPLVQGAGLQDELDRVGWPVADPSYEREVENPTWVFQRFAPTGRSDEDANTLEIRGRDPTLYVERLGGDPYEFSLAHLTLNEFTPTVWQSFQCHVEPGETLADEVRLSSPGANRDRVVSGGRTLRWGVSWQRRPALAVGDALAARQFGEQAVLGHHQAIRRNRSGSRIPFSKRRSFPRSPDVRAHRRKRGGEPID